MLGWAWLTMVLAAAGCCDHREPAAPVPGESPASVAKPVSATGSSGSGWGAVPAPRPLVAAAGYADLPIDGHRPAVVSLPLGATSRRPVIVVAHGAVDRPEWHCELWREIVGNRAFVLCLRGVRTIVYEPTRGVRYFFPDHQALGREMSAALEALAARYAEHVDLRAPLFAGYSQGAIMGALLLPQHPARFARAALIEGGYGRFQEWNVALAERFRQRGGRRVALACGRQACVEQARVTAHWLVLGGLAARVLHARGAGHTYRGAMEREVDAAFHWLIEGDPRW